MALLTIGTLVTALCLGVRGEEITLRVEHAMTDENLQCVLPSTLLVQLESSSLGLAKTIGMVKTDVIAASGRHVKIVKNGADGMNELHHRDLEDAKVLESQAYHNHSVGAAFVVNCVVSDTGHKYFTMEGSVYFGARKFRLKPVTPDKDNKVKFEPQRVAIIYSMTPVWEHRFADAAGIRAPGNVFLSPDGRNNTIPITSGNRYNPQEEAINSDLPGRYRYKRSTQIFHIDILPVVDFASYSRWLTVFPDPNTAASELRNYLVIVLTALDMRLQTLSLTNFKLRVRMISPVISTEASTSSFIESIKVVTATGTKVSAPTLLETFNTWVTEQTSLPAHDHAMLFTSYDLIPSIDPTMITTNNTRGLAYIATVCRDRSVSLVEDLGAYQSENVAAHELGHSLGALHDGDNNLCVSSERYLMATGSFPQTKANALHPWLFSACSSAAIVTYFNQLLGDGSFLSNCLLDEAGQEVNVTKTLSAQTICENYLGDGAFPCRNFTEFSEICTSLYCRLPDTSVCQQVLAATGTCCGNGTMCVAGECIEAPEGECSIDENCPLGDQPGVILNSATCDQLNSSYCYIDDVRKACCDTCQRLESDVPGCTYGDKEVGCSANECGTTFTLTGLSYDFICCGTCTNTGCRDIPSFNVTGIGENYNCSGLIADTGSYICYATAVHTDFCCQECERIRDKDSEVCPYGDRSDCSSLTSSSQCSTQIQGQCCETCARLQELEATTTAPTTVTSTATTATATTAPITSESFTATTELTTATAATTQPTTSTTPLGPGTTTTTTAEATTSRESAETTAASPVAITTTTTRVTIITSTAVTVTLSRTTVAATEGSTADTAGSDSDNAGGSDPSDGYGYKPTGFQGCYLPPCAAPSLSCSLSICFILACVSSVRIVLGH